MSKAQSASPRRLKVMEDGEGLQCVSSLEISQERRNQWRDPLYLLLGNLGHPGGRPLSSIVRMEVKSNNGR